MQRTMDYVSDILDVIPSPRGITDADYEAVAPMIEAVKTFARVTDQGVIVSDMFRKNFLYVSDSPLVLLNHPEAEVLEKGYRFMVENTPHEDQKMMAELIAALFKSNREMGFKDDDAYTISCNFRFMIYHRPVLVNHKVTPLKRDADGRVWLALCLVSHSAHSRPGHITATIGNSTSRMYYSFEEHSWTRQDEQVELTQDERSMLYLTAQGYTMREIADRMFQSVDTVKMYRKHVFSKLGVSNISEALVHATNYNLL